MSTLVKYAGFGVCLLERNNLNGYFEGPQQEEDCLGNENGYIY